MPRHDFKTVITILKALRGEALTPYKLLKILPISHRNVLDRYLKYMVDLDLIQSRPNSRGGKEYFPSEDGEALIQLLGKKIRVKILTL